ncbi:MAG: cyclic nucleotide-binding domain-containing protein, partial [Pseudomonadota bacterium]
ARVAVKSENPTASAALAELLTREIVPSRGRITLGGHAFNELPQDVIARRIGYAHSEPHIFQGTLGDNLLMPFRHEPHLDGHPEVSAWVDEARRGGNPADPLGVDWVDPAVAGFDTVEEVKAWWFKLVEAMGVDEFMVRRTMRNVLRPGSQEGLRQRIVDIRPEVARRLEEAGLNDIVHRYHPDKFNPVSPLGSNLLFALPVRPLEQETLANQENFVRLMREEGVDDEILGIATGVIDGLVSTFGAGGTDHPIFRSLNLSEALFEKLAKLSAKLRMSGEPSLSDREIGLLMTVPFAFSAEKIGPIFKEEFKAKVLEVRKSSGGRMLAQLKGLFQPIREDTYLPIKTVLGNAIFGRISDMAGAREEDVIQVVVDVISEAGLRGEVAEAIWGVETSIGAENLPSVFRERVAFSRAAIKRPDILVLRNALASHDAESRSQTRARLRGLMPDTTKVFIEKEFFDTSEYDLTVEISDGRIDGVTRAATDDYSRTDLAQKLQMIAKADLFAKLDRQSQRLLAFSAQWYKAKAGQVIFREGQPPDAAYLCVKGEAAIYYPDRSMRAEPITQVTAGRLVGDLAIILDRARVLDLEAQSDCVFLRIPGPELRTVIESDVRVATSLLETVAGHLIDAGGAVARASQGQSRYAGSAPEDGNGGIGDDAGGGAGAPSRPEPTREPEPQ